MTILGRIGNIFENCQYNSRIYPRAGRSPLSTVRYMEIPLSGNTFELPLLAYTKFMNIPITSRTSSTIVVRLYSEGAVSRYSALTSILQDALSSPTRNRLIKIIHPNLSQVYYVTYGTVFDKDMKPILMLSWEMERAGNNDQIVQYNAKCPVIRIDPQVCILKQDKVQKYLADTLFHKTLGMAVYPPDTYSISYQVKTVFETSPFVVRECCAPSISTNNQDLLQLATDYIDEIIE